MRKLGRLAALMLALSLTIFDHAAIGAEQPPEVLREAQQAVFTGCLELMPRVVPTPDTPDIFAVYSWGDEAHKKQVVRYCTDLKLAGFTQIWFDEWTGRPGAGDIATHTDQILRAQKVIVFGSPSLKTKYEVRTGGVTEEITLLRTGMSQRGGRGMIPVWFGGLFDANFPGGLSPFLGRDLSADYHDSFFELLRDLRQSEPEVLRLLVSLRERFRRQCGMLTPSALEEFGARRAASQARLAKLEEKFVQECLQRALDEREREGISLRVRDIESQLSAGALRHLSLSGPLTDKVLLGMGERIRDWSQVKELSLDLRGCSLSASGCDQIARFSNLQVFNLEVSSLEELAALRFTCCSSLRQIDLRNNPFLDQADSGALLRSLYIPPDTAVLLPKEAQRKFAALVFLSRGGAPIQLREEVFSVLEATVLKEFCPQAVRDHLIELLADIGTSENAPAYLKGAEGKVISILKDLSRSPSRSVRSSLIDALVSLAVKEGYTDYNFKGNMADILQTLAVGVAPLGEEILRLKALYAVASFAKSREVPIPVRAKATAFLHAQSSRVGAVLQRQEHLHLKGMLL